jgi:hypothetical protein
MVYYTYKITNLINGKYYYGKRSFNGDDELNDSYLGSGNLIKLAIKKYGKENFKKEIINKYPTQHELNEAEEKLIDEHIVKDKMSYNIALGGHGGNLGELVNKKIKEICNSPEYKNKMSNIINNPVVKDKIIKSIKNTMSCPIWRDNHSKTQKKIQNTPENKLRNSKNQKIAQNRDTVKNKKSKTMKTKFKNDHNMIKKHKEACNTEEFKEAQRVKTSNTKWIHNKIENIQKYVKIDVLDQYLNNGWEYGMLPRNK